MAKSLGEIIDNVCRVSRRCLSLVRSDSLHSMLAMRVKYFPAKPQNHVSAVKVSAKLRKNDLQGIHTHTDVHI